MKVLLSTESGFFGSSDKCEMCLKIVGGNNYIFYVIYKCEIRSEGSIAIVKIFDFDFFMIFGSTSLPQSKNVF